MKSSSETRIYKVEYKEKLIDKTASLEIRVICVKEREFVISNLVFSKEESLKNLIDTKSKTKGLSFPFSIGLQTTEKKLMDYFSLLGKNDGVVMSLEDVTNSELIFEKAQ